MSTERERDKGTHTNTSDRFHCERLLFGFSERSRARSRRAGCLAIATDRSMKKSRSLHLHYLFFPALKQWREPLFYLNTFFVLKKKNKKKKLLLLLLLLLCCCKLDIQQGLFRFQKLTGNERLSPLDSWFLYSRDPFLKCFALSPLHHRFWQLLSARLFL